MPAKSLATKEKASESGMQFRESLKKSDAELTLSRVHKRTALSAPGDLPVAVTKEASGQLIAHKENPLSETKYGLEQLRAQGQLTAPEFNSMTEICDAVFAAERGKIDIRDAYEMVRGAYDALVVDKASSPMALAIASVASGVLASNLGATPKTSAPASRSNGDIGLVGGIVAGGIIGGAIGGAGAGVIGGVIGGIVGGVAGACIKF